MEKIKQILTGWVEGIRNVPATFVKLGQAAKELGFFGLLKAAFADMFLGRTAFQWLYLIGLSSVPLILEFTSGSDKHDWMGLFASWTGIVCVIMVAEGRASNYVFGFINSLIYFVLSYNSAFYGEVMTAVFFLAMQPIGLYTWLAARINETEDETPEISEFETRSLSFFGWVKWLSFTALVWGIFGLLYQSIGSARPFRDSVTDGTNWTGQFLMTYLYREQWLFWIATNLFSIYLWWGNSIHMQAMYWVYALNSVVGWYQWSKAMKKG
ncbi:nicotinamide riboside transporter PnuC [Streptococcus sp. A34]|uniref:nicotinamide riboside transporter PnuC n=1 Tax=Streptococcus sp. A34 TaxID=3373130 RepID=UPI001553D4E0|nr:nicotinamide riboside transporter PnuC [Streptococcus suis]NQP18986.1 nicotinamide riboside transporter PnuC [Streptococcus suis]WNF83333.1 nicotinamide riboside transporter PnuC [Streptococcus suis]